MDAGPLDGRAGTCPAPGPSRVRDLASVRVRRHQPVTEILQGAGFTDVGFRSIEQPLLFGGGGTIDDAVEFFRDGSFGMTLLAAAGPEETANGLAAVAEAFRAHLTPRGVELGTAAWLVTAATPWTCSLAVPATS